MSWLSLFLHRYFRQAPPAPPPPTLGTLSLSNSSLFVTDPPGTVIGAISGTTGGSSLAIFPTDSRFALSGLNLLVGLGALSAGSTSVTVRETLAGATNTPNSTTFPLTIQNGVGPPLIGPGALWNGSAGSGGSHPLDPTRTTAKPMAQWWAQDRQRIADDLLIGVYADAGGLSGGSAVGVAYVDFWVEGAVQRVLAPRINTDTDANGNVRKRFGYWVTLDHSAFLAKSASNNTVTIYATIVPNDTSMQSRVIGPITVYPEPSLHDFSATVSPSNNDVSPNFTTLKKALNAAQAVAANAPLITFTSTAFYEAENGTWTSRDTAKGFATLVAAAGVTATIGRAAFPTGQDSNTWSWDPRWSGIEFRGSGVVLDYKNLGGMTSQGNRHFWINGARVTNSVLPDAGQTSSRDTNYWNKGMRPSGIGGQAGFGYIDDAIIEYVPQACCFLARVSNTSLHDLAGDIFTATPFVTGNYHNSMNQDFFATAINAFTVTYTGAGSATIERTGTNNDVDATINLRVNGTIVDTFIGSHVSTAPLFNIDQIVGRINANAGFNAAVLDSSRRATSIEPFAQTALSSTPVTFTTRFDLHGDWWQAHTGTVARENVVLERNIQLRYGVTGANQSLFLDETAGNQDILWCNNWIDGGILPANAGKPRSHVVCRHNTLGAIGIPNSGAEVHEPYSVYENNVAFDAVFKSTFANPWGVRDDFINNGYTSGGHGVPSGANYIGGFTISGTGASARAANLTNYAAGDGRPKAASTLATTLKPSTEALDVRLNPRAANDAVGAFALGASAPVYPF